MSAAGPGFLFGGFFLFFALIWVVGFGSYAVGIAALISIARHPDAAFGPWWDNTKQSWVIGVVISFLLPFGPLVTGLMWFTSGKAPLRHGGAPAGRPFWVGPPKPVPWGYGPPPGGTPPPGPGAPSA